MLSHNPDIFCVCETWLSSDLPDILLCTDSYTVIRYDTGSIGGGVALFFRNCIKFTLVDIPPEYRDLEVVVLMWTSMVSHSE